MYGTWRYHHHPLLLLLGGAQCLDRANLDAFGEEMLLENWPGFRIFIRLLIEKLAVV
jgi:hypothetical protein